MNQNYYLQHIESIPALIDELFSSLDQEAQRLADELCTRPIKSVYLYGSGDSWAAAVGALGAFSELCHIPAYALTSMQASRYAPGYAMPDPDTTLVIGLSNSGRVARALEATSAMSAFGYSPLLITSNPQSPSAKAAGKIFHTPIPSFDPICVPGVRSYVIAQLSLYLLAIRLSEKKNMITSSQGLGLINYLHNTGRQLKALLEANRYKLSSFANLCAEEKRVEFLSAGPCRAAADFGMAKTLEATGYTALSPELEEFSHMNFFSLRPEHIPTVLICSQDARCLSRCLEMEESMIHQGRPYIVITDSNEFLACEERTIRVPFALSEKFAPLVFSFLTASLTAYMPLEEGDIYLHDHKGPFLEEGFPTIMNSKLVL